MMQSRVWLAIRLKTFCSDLVCLFNAPSVIQNGMELEYHVELAALLRAIIGIQLFLMIMLYFVI